MYVLAAPSTETHYNFFNIPTADVTSINSNSTATIRVRTVGLSGVTPGQGDRILVSDLTGDDSTVYNGLYTVTSSALDGNTGFTNILTSRDTSSASAAATLQVLGSGVYALEEAYSVVGDTLYPADRCTWHFGQETGVGGYSIADATFYPGNSATGVALNGDVRLGYIGKSGRFVEIAR